MSAGARDDSPPKAPRPAGPLPVAAIVERL